MTSGVPEPAIHPRSVPDDRPADALHLRPEPDGTVRLKCRGADEAAGPKRGGASSRVLAFNISHSGPFAVYAVSESGPVGVDVEVAKPAPARRPRERTLPPTAAVAIYSDRGARLGEQIS